MKHLSILITALAMSAVANCCCAESFRLDGSFQGNFLECLGISVTDDGRILVKDKDAMRVRVYTLDGAVTDIWSTVQSPNWIRPLNIAVDESGLVYVVGEPSS